MAAPSILQMAAHTASIVSSLAFSSNVSKNSFLFAVTVGAQPITISDNLNGNWTILAQGEAQLTLNYAIAYLPVAKVGATTVSFSSSTLPVIAEISSSTLGNTSAVASGTVAGSSAVEFVCLYCDQCGTVAIRIRLYYR